MEYLIIILIIIIILLSLYLFLLLREIRRITNCLKKVKDEDSNQLINKELSSNVIGNMLKEINNLLRNHREEKMEYEKKNKALRRMITNISHDLRTPLTSALGYINLIDDSKLSPKEKKSFLKIVKDRLQHLDELMNSFFEFSCIVSSNRKISFELINIVGILEECIAHYYDDFESTNRKIVFHNKIKSYNILSNQTMLLRIFDNLIGNAYKHSIGDLTIKVQENEGVSICFINELSYKDLDVNHIFDEFYTVDISRTKKNTGLGLAIVKEFTENLNGTISAIKEKDNLRIVLSFKK